MAGRGRKTLAQKIVANKVEQAKCEERLAQLKEEEKALFLQVVEESGVSVEDAIKAIHICKNKIRFHSLHPAIDIDSIEISGHQKEDEVLITSLVGLPDKYKEVVLLYYIEGYSCKEVGKILKLTESTVKKRLERGRNLLKKELGEE